MMWRKDYAMHTSRKEILTTWISSVYSQRSGCQEHSCRGELRGEDRRLWALQRPGGVREEDDGVDVTITITALYLHRPVSHVLSILTMYPAYWSCDQHFDHVLNILIICSVYSPCAQHIDRVLSILTMCSAYSPCTQHIHHVLSILIISLLCTPYRAGYLCDGWPLSLWTTASTPPTVTCECFSPDPVHYVPRYLSYPPEPSMQYLEAKHVDSKQVEHSFWCFFNRWSYGVLLWEIVSLGRWSMIRSSYFRLNSSFCLSYW